MPIAVEALPMDKFEDWVRSQGGTVPGDAPAEDAASEEVASEEAAEETTPEADAADAAPAE
jgi:cytochrome c oxidase subunit 2